MNRFILLLMCAVGTFLLSSCILGTADCAWSAPVLTWVDSNENNVWDEGELPVEGVEFQVNDTRNNYLDVGSSAISDWEGNSRVLVWLPGCPSAKFEVLAIPPAGYYLLSDQALKIKGVGYGSDDPILFPVQREIGFPTSTPYAPKLQCDTYPIGAEIIKTASDGSVWAATWNSAAVYQEEYHQWKIFPVDTNSMSLIENIDIGAEGEVWIHSWNGIGLLQNGKWEINGLDEDSPDYIVSNVNPSNDGELWFMVPAPPDTFAKFGIENSSWSIYGPENRADDVNLRITLMRGVSTWFAISEYDPDDKPQPEVLYPNWTIQDSHTFTSNEFNIIPLEGWIEDIEIDTTGRLWIAHSFGISNFSPAHGEWIDYSPPTIFNYMGSPIDIAVGPDNAIWSIYSDAHPRLLKLIPDETNASESKWVSYDPRDGFPDVQGITSLAIDPEGNIWIGFGSNDVTARCKRLSEP